MARTSRFEDLSNEIFYEIIDFLDTCDAYEAFYDLNDRFRQFFKHLTLLYKINLNLTCRTPFHQRCQHIQSAMLHRIISLRVSNWIALDHLLLQSITFDAAFTRLESLTLMEMRGPKLSAILANLPTLPRLISLTATAVGMISDPAALHQLLFVLPHLKYCNTTFQWNVEHSWFATFNSPTSPITYFVSKSAYDLSQLAPVLSCMPHLIHLSIDGYIPAGFITWTPIISNQLTYFQLHHSAGLYELEIFIANFTHKLRVLRISSSAVMNASHVKRWQRLISSYLPDLQTFDLQYFGQVNSVSDGIAIRDEFNSTFWWKRKWFFTFQQYYHDGAAYILLCSQNASSSKTFAARSIRAITIDYQRTRIDFASSTLTMTTDARFVSETPFFRKETTPFVHERLAKIDVSLSTDATIKLLHCFSSVQVLVMPAYTPSQLQFSGSIGQAVIQNPLSRHDLPALLNTFPHVQSLDINVVGDDFELLVRILYRHKTNRSSPLYLVCIRNAHQGLLNRVQKVIEREKFDTLSHSLELLSGTMYIRW